MSGSPSAGPPPEAPRHPVTHSAHGVNRIDDFYWLRDRDDPRVLAHLEAENAYTAAVMAPLEPLQTSLYDALRAQVPEADMSAPVRRGGFRRYTRYEAGKQYPLHCRRREDSGGAPSSGPEEITLDVNAVAAGRDYCDVSSVVYSPDQRLLAYAVDTTGRERYAIRVVDLALGSTREEVTEATADLVWGSDGRWFLYTVADETERAHRVCRHRLGSDPAEDHVVFEEPDPAYHVDIAASCTERFAVITSSSKTTNEQRLVALDSAAASPFTVLVRRPGIRYEVADRGDRLFIRTDDTGPNFRVVEAPLRALTPDDCREYRPECGEITVLGLRTFAGHLVLVERANGSNRIRVIDLDGGGEHAEHTVAFDESEHVVELGDNPDFETTMLRLDYSSLVTPPTQLDYDMNSRQRVVVKRREVPGYDPAQYQALRIDAVAEDGVRVPISLVRPRDAPSGPQPLVLEGYGSYGYSYEARFEAHRVALLDRGVSVAIAHVRGGGELGERWRLAANMGRKRTTFTDFVSCAEALIAAGITSSDRLAITGRSAGGLLVGAVLNMRPDLFRAAVAGVPFVDVVTTMSDPSIPLTTAEYQEWGDPADPEAFAYMRSYSPYDNVQATDLPWLLVTAGLNDPRVSYWEPAKWVARLRQQRTNDNPLLLRTNLGKGHFAFTGRYERLRERALELAFLLAALGVADA
ncbi:MAG: S9 family peptidase [Candidatus Dormibacteria bacterium]